MTYLAKKTICTNFEGEVVPADGPEASHIVYMEGVEVPEDEIEQYKKMSRKLPAVHEEDAEDDEDGDESEGEGEDGDEPKEDASQPTPSGGGPAGIPLTHPLTALTPMPATTVMPLPRGTSITTDSVSKATTIGGGGGNG